jgi:hypothetical protein
MLRVAPTSRLHDELSGRKYAAARLGRPQGDDPLISVAGDWCPPDGAAAGNILDTAGRPDHWQRLHNSSFGGHAAGGSDPSRTQQHASPPLQLRDIASGALPLSNSQATVSRAAAVYASTLPRRPLGGLVRGAAGAKLRPHRAVPGFPLTEADDQAARIESATREPPADGPLTRSTASTARHKIGQHEVAARIAGELTGLAAWAVASAESEHAIRHRNLSKLWTTPGHEASGSHSPSTLGNDEAGSPSIPGRLVTFTQHGAPPRSGDRLSECAITAIGTDTTLIRGAATPSETMLGQKWIPHCATSVRVSGAHACNQSPQRATSVRIFSTQVYNQSSIFSTAEPRVHEAASPAAREAAEAYAHALARSGSVSFPLEAKEIEYIAALLLSDLTRDLSADDVDVLLGGTIAKLPV